MIDDKKKLREDAIEIGVYVLIIALVVFAVSFIFLPIFDQAVSWLKTGTIPDRDLFWFTANVSCAATGGYARGWEGMDLCRPDSIYFTDWVGVNTILNYAFDVHIAIVAVIGATLVLWVAFAVFNTQYE
ncbi:hypothetical protein [Pseudovibrio sp. FO-BEG1]|uniref:hypothetical protein n=1 Tax=Pseudovibrio sp. (strain FO-BEG1) TaxID=911045 RepID=UPI0005A207E4|nr:hypothetical protein [Pseudovibrio sp. FO-BEG1]